MGNISNWLAQFHWCLQLQVITNVSFVKFARNNNNIFRPSEARPCQTRLQTSNSGRSPTWVGCTKGDGLAPLGSHIQVLMYFSFIHIIIIIIGSLLCVFRISWNFWASFPPNTHRWWIGAKKSKLPFIFTHSSVCLSVNIFGPRELLLSMFVCSQGHEFLLACTRLEFKSIIPMSGQHNIFVREVFQIKISDGLVLPWDSSKCKLMSSYGDYWGVSLRSLYAFRV